MTRRLEDQIRRYTAALDAEAPAVEDLLPAGMADDFSVPRSTVEATMPLTRPPAERRVPGWVWGIAAAIAILALSLPLLLWLSDSEPDVATTLPPDPGAAPSLRYDPMAATLEGTGWAPGAEVTVAIGGFEATATADGDGRFALSGASLPDCCFEPLVVSDGSTSLTVDDLSHFEMRRIDADADIIAGELVTSEPGPHEIRFVIGDGTDVYETSTVSTDNNWQLDLSDRFDLLPGMSVVATVVMSDMTLTATQTTFIRPYILLHPDREGSLEGAGFLPYQVLEISIDGAILPDEVTTDAAGVFRVITADSGINLDAASVVSVSDGVSTMIYDGPTLTYDVLDPATGTAAGTSSAADGEPIWFELFVASGPANEPDRYVTAEGVVTGGRWMVRFDPIHPGETALDSTVTIGQDGSEMQVNAPPG